MKTSGSQPSPCLVITTEEADAFMSFDGTLRRLVTPTPFRIHKTKEWRLSLRSPHRFTSPQALCDYLVHNNPWARGGDSVRLRLRNSIPFALIFIHQVEARTLPSDTRDCPVEVLMHWGLLTTPNHPPR